MAVLDASAVLAFLKDEPGSAEVEKSLSSGYISSINFSEVAQKILLSGADFELVQSLLESYGLKVKPVTKEDGVQAARMYRKGSGLSIADRICIALGQRMSERVLTADQAWGESAGIKQIR